MRVLRSLVSIALFGVLLMLVSVAAPLTAAHAANGPSVIRDAEMERIIRDYANPLFRAAGIPPDSIRIRVLNDDGINAFVTNGNRMYINSGLLLRSETPDQLIGVIAHETGHIAGGHLARMGDEINQAGMTSLASMALGAALGLATGRGDVGMAAMSLGQQVAIRNFFAYTRAQESSADQFALKILDSTGQSAAGLLHFFETLGDQELLMTERQDPYVRTHPLTQERVTAVRHHVEATSGKNLGPTQDRAAHDRLVGKLYGFLRSQGRTLDRYPDSDQSVAARYARAVAYFRRGDLATALPLIDGLIEEQPNDPFFHELKGQMLLEGGRLPESQQAYQKALDLAPDEPLIALSLGHVLVEQGTQDSLAASEPVLRGVVAREPGNAFAWRLLGTSYGQRGDASAASTAMAEHALLSGEPAQALYHAEKALEQVKQSDPHWLRLQDIRQEAQNRLERARQK